MSQHPLAEKLAPAVLMVRPIDFDFNEETGIDNEFQTRVTYEPGDVNKFAMAEFEGMTETLRLAGIEVLVLEQSAQTWIKTPDAVFPNNWFATEPDGTLLTFPMLAENRRAERRIPDIEVLLEENGYYIRNLINVGKFSESKLILEGTGSMVIDHVNGIVYAARSQRCHPGQFKNFIELCSYKEGLLFDTRTPAGKPVYHTNVLMSIGLDFAVVCADCIVETDRPMVMNRLRESKEVVEISIEQMSRHFCGNILEVRNNKNEPVLVMSRAAFGGFRPEQIKTLEKHATLVPVDIPTIEKVGGGSARCMMAEIFLPNLRNKNLFA